MLNKAELIGNIGDIKKHEKVLAVSIATNKSMKDKDGEWQQKTTWHNCKFFGKYLDSIYKRIHKGDLVYITGEIDYSDYEGKKYTNIINCSIKVLKKAQSAEAEGGESKPEEAPETDDGDLPF